MSRQGQVTRVLPIISIAVPSAFGRSFLLLFSSFFFFFFCSHRVTRMCVYMSLARRSALRDNDSYTGARVRTRARNYCTPAIILLCIRNAALNYFNRLFLSFFQTFEAVIMANLVSTRADAYRKFRNVRAINSLLSLELIYLYTCVYLVIFSNLLTQSFVARSFYSRTTNSLEIRLIIIGYVYIRRNNTLTLTAQHGYSKKLALA